MVDKVPARGLARVAVDQRRTTARVREVERPSGTQYAQLLDTVNAKLNQIDQLVQDAINTYSYTKSAIDDKVEILNNNLINGLNGKANTNHQHSAADITAGTLTRPLGTTGNVTTTADLTAFRMFNQSVTTAITDTRVAVYGRNSDGFIGTASSSERFKVNIVAADIDPAKVLEITSVYYQYQEQIEKAEALRDPNRPIPLAYDPHAHAHVELGVIAERMVELGFWEVVIWERDAQDKLVLDEQGNPVPFGVHYHLIAVLQQVAMQWMNRRLEAIEAHLGLTPVK